jgi:LmbE family N-acetylglucosaminyl deacetylase
MAVTETPSRLKVLVTGAHPGDPECGCAGTIARYTEAGHNVTLLYLNRGEGFCGGEELSRCAAIRTAEAEKACSILHARPLFAGQYDGRAVVDKQHYDSFATLYRSLEADIVFTHWPMDTHRDHRALSALTLDAWIETGKRAALLFYEVADDTQMFTPSEFVDISKQESVRHAACYAHASQRPEVWYPRQVAITTVRGREHGVEQADGFVRHWESRPGLLP